MNSDRKQMMDDRKSLMREFRQVRQAMGPAKGKREKHDVDPREVLMTLKDKIVDNVRSLHHRNR
jgi:hypothetical protein